MRIIRNPGPAAPEKLRARLTEAAARLKSELPRADLSGLSEYNRHYLQRKLAVIDDALRLYAGLLALCLARSPKALSEICLVEYGGGLGIMAMLAAAAGVGRVLMNDIYDVSVKDAKSLAAALGLSAGHYVCGTMEDVTRLAGREGFAIDAVISYDVIEHVYDAAGLFHILAALPAPVRVAMASGANPYNPRIRRQIQKLHHRVENQDREPGPGHKERDLLAGYRSARRSIIAEQVRAAGGSLPEADLDRLAESTRCLAREDIRRIVDLYLAHGALPLPPAHPSNTCDPFTGNFAERLMNPRELSGILSKNGFSASVIPGRYGSAPQRLKAAAKSLLNALIRISGPAAMALSPYYVVYGEKEAPA